MDKHDVLKHFSELVLEWPQADVRCFAGDDWYITANINYVPGEESESRIAVMFVPEGDVSGHHGRTGDRASHEAICRQLSRIYHEKNRAYGDSFHKSYQEEGFAMPRVRLTDKLERFKKLSRDPDIDPGDESLKDTLLDLANYAIMTIMELDRE